MSLLLTGDGVGVGAGGGGGAILHIVFATPTPPQSQTLRQNTGLSSSRVSSNSCCCILTCWGLPLVPTPWFVRPMMHSCDFQALALQEKMDEQRELKERLAKEERERKRESLAHRVSNDNNNSSSFTDCCVCPSFQRGGGYRPTDFVGSPTTKNGTVWKKHPRVCLLERHNPIPPVL